MGLQAEIKQTKPFESLEVEAYLNVVRTHSRLIRGVHTLMQEAGLTEPTYNILRILRGAGKAGLDCSDIGDRMLSRVPDVTRILDRLEEKGLIERFRTDADRRKVFSRITPAGKRVLAKLDQPLNDMHARQLGHMKRSELKELVRLLTKAREHANG